MRSNEFVKFSIHAEDLRNVPKYQGKPGILDISISSESMKLIGLFFIYWSLDLKIPQKNENIAESFELKVVEIQPGTNNIILKYIQTINNIQVYNSSIIVELDKQIRFVSLTAQITFHLLCSAQNVISTGQIIEKAKKELYIINNSQNTYPLYHYYDVPTCNWKLAYVLKEVTILEKQQDSQVGGIVKIVDLILDAKAGESLSMLPCADHLSTVATSINDINEYKFTVSTLSDNNFPFFINKNLKVKIYDFGYRSIFFQKNELPGKLIKHPSPKGSLTYTNEYMNICKVANFFNDVLQRNGIDNKGKAYIASVNCIYTDNLQEWKNAAWYCGQLVFGQIKIGKKYRSYASALDIVAHEVTHGVIDNIISLENRGETGALGESYADIFAIIISNWGRPSQNNWNWILGEELQLDHLPLRNIAEPEKLGQPAHMKAYQDLPLTLEGDQGGIHINSGIHNKAAYNIITTKNQDGNFLLDIEETALLFYLSLHQLPPKAKFLDSMHALSNSTKSLFRGSPLKKLSVLSAIENAFNNVGLFN